MRSFADNASKFFRLLAKRRSAYPLEIQIEITNVCNLKCSMCPHTHGMIPQRDFPVERFTDLVKYNPAPKRLVLTGWGEPLMHKHFFELIDLARRYWPETQVRFTTNGILLDETRREEIARRRIAAVTVSLDLWPERTEVPREWRDILHPPSPKTIRNLEHYCRDTRLRDASPIVLQSLLVEENAKDIERIIEFASIHSIRTVNLVRMQSYPENPVQRPAWNTEQQRIGDAIRFGTRLGVKVRSLNYQSIVLQLATRFDRVCMKTDDSLYITIDGIVTPCCNLRSCAIGEIAARAPSIAEVWNSPAERKFFRDQRPVCGGCDALFYKYRR